MIHTDKVSVASTNVVYKLQKMEQLSLSESTMTVLETISITTSYTKAMEVILEHPGYFVVPHAIVHEEEPLDGSQVPLTGI